MKLEIHVILNKTVSQQASEHSQAGGNMFLWTKEGIRGNLSELSIKKNKKQKTFIVSFSLNSSGPIVTTKMFASWTQGQVTCSRPTE